MILLLAMFGCKSEELPGSWPTDHREGMVEIIETTFKMGHKKETPGPYGDEWFENELPRHKVTLSTYAIDKDEVTVGQWVEFLNAPGNGTHHYGLHPVEWNGSAFAALANHQPIRYVSWYDATVFCAWVGKRLPTEAEWELAARGDDGRRYPWGEDNASCAKANYFTNYTLCVSEPTDVGSYSPDGDSPYGMRDMAGNVAEWVQDRYGNYEKDEVTDPNGASDGGYRVVRGGGFRDVDNSIRTTSRFGAAPDRRSEGVGFRCAGDP
ncbi:MAG: SUMF1/EgtB/PvdO family nonheme iron enzyme [Proteobacteria bacterium]|jgi:formylglycine-generating enzyme required for sulfatase activity|nr:SUMF1/EgtB/PvdO family nonheme iron enzyme [Pseudomonadota bacterium]